MLIVCSAVLHIFFVIVAVLTTFRKVFWHPIGFYTLLSLKDMILAGISLCQILTFRAPGSAHFQSSKSSLSSKSRSGQSSNWNWYFLVLRSIFHGEPTSYVQSEWLTRSRFSLPYRQIFKKMADPHIRSSYQDFRNVSSRLVVSGGSQPTSDKATQHPVVSPNSILSSSNCAFGWLLLPWIDFCSSTTSWTRQ